MLADRRADPNSSVDANQKFRLMRDEPCIVDAVGAYNDAGERNDKAGQVQALSFLAHQFKLHKLQSLPFVEPPDKDTYRAARSHANVHGVGQTKPVEKITRCRFKIDKLKQALRHIHSPTFLQQVAFGEKSIKFDDGTTLKIPALQRKQLKEHMWQSYQSVFEDEGIGRSQYLDAVEISTAIQQKSLAALDNIAVRYGTENFKSMVTIIESLASKGQGLGQVAAQLKLRITKLEAHLKSSLEQHLEPSSTCAAHCVTCLTGGGGSDYSNECSGACNQHPDYCELCGDEFLLIAEMQGLLGHVSCHMSAPDIEDQQFLIKKCELYLKIYHSHQVRGYNEERAKAKLIEGLTSCMFGITIDWKQKWIMTVFRESMAEYFGKSGIPWHGAMVVLAGGCAGSVADCGVTGCACR